TPFSGRVFNSRCQLRLVQAPQHYLLSNITSQPTFTQHCKMCHHHNQNLVGELIALPFQGHCGQVRVYPQGGKGGNVRGGHTTGGNARGGKATGRNAKGGNAKGGNAKGRNAKGGNATGGSARGNGAKGGRATGGGAIQN
ncbi:hypothetical protein QBC44DRAFT_389690, partial [Cladorrhinum sp. PSN332]